MPNNRAFKDPAYTRSIDPEWLAAIRGRFADRDDIGRERVYDTYFASEGLARNEVFECFDLIECEFGYIAGLLRPDDGLEKLIEPISGVGVFQSAGYEIMAGDRQLWLGDELFNRMRKHGTYDHRRSIRMETLDDFVKAWCGRLPGLEPTNRD
jgi:hypothetical protein